MMAMIRVSHEERVIFNTFTDRDTEIYEHIFTCSDWRCPGRITG